MKVDKAIKATFNTNLIILNGIFSCSFSRNYIVNVARFPLQVEMEQILLRHCLRQQHPYV